MSAGDLAVYRVSDELAAAMRASRAAAARFIDEVLTPFRDKHPDNKPLWTRTISGERCVGFADGKPDEDPPAGLSRALTRLYLIPARASAGRYWRTALEQMNQMPSGSEVLHTFKVRGEIIDGSYCLPGWVDMEAADAEGNGVFIEMSRPFHTTPEALTPIKLSEYYAIKEAALNAEENNHADDL